MRYQVKRELVEGVETILLIDTDTDTTCAFVPSIGNNLIQFNHHGQDYLSVPPSVEKMADQVTCYQYGSAILFPPNRVKNATFTFNEKVYEFPKNEDPNHLHGELCYKPWKVVTANANQEDGCTFTSEFRIKDHPDMMEYFPHSLVFTLTYVLKEGKLTLSGKVENNGDTEAPFALGFHPYFPTPQGKGENVRLSIPAINEWPITNEAFVQGLPEQTAFSETIKSGMTLETVNDLDCWLVTLDQHQDALCEIAYVDLGKSLIYQIDSKAFPYVVIFQPDWTNAISLEPYSYVTDGFNLPWSSDTTGAKGIKPNEQINFHLSIQVKPFEGR